MWAQPAEAIEAFLFVCKHLIAGNVADLILPIFSDLRIYSSWSKCGRQPIFAGHAERVYLRN
jgi:hypothetical protein